MYGPDPCTGYILIWCKIQVWIFIYLINLEINDNLKWLDLCLSYALTTSTEILNASAFEEIISFIISKKKYLFCSQSFSTSIKTGRFVRPEKPPACSFGALFESFKKVGLKIHYTLFPIFELSKQAHLRNNKIYANFAILVGSLLCY